jgi:hypothetical protein
MTHRWPFSRSDLDSSRVSNSRMESRFQMAVERSMSLLMGEAGTLEMAAV